MFTTKYTAEVILEFKALDRLLYRISDLYNLDEILPDELIERMDDCHLYLLGKRPRLSIVPGSVQILDEVAVFRVAVKLKGQIHECAVALPIDHLDLEGCTLDVSPYPHREIITRNYSGEIVGRTLLANYAHILPSVPQEAKDLEVVYIGKGLSRSAQDRLERHSTLQRILADINSNEPDHEVFALVYCFEYKRHLMAFPGATAEITGSAAEEHMSRVLNFQPSIDEQVALVEAAVISYFRTDSYNKQYLGFPEQQHAVLRGALDCDFAAVVVQLDHATIGNLRIYSRVVPPHETHLAVIDLRRLEGKFSIFELARDKMMQRTDQGSV